VADFLILLLEAFNYVVFFYFVALNGVYLFTSLIAFREIRDYVLRLKSLDLSDLLGSSGMPPVTVLVPAFNEEATCVASVRSLLSLNYADYSILVINDGSTDQTLERLIEEFDLVRAARLPTAELVTASVRRTYQSRRHQNLWVIDKENGGKADALNAGLTYSATPLFCAVDADSLLERDALIRIVRPFLEDAKTVAAGGIIRIANDCDVVGGAVRRIRMPRSLLAQFQVLEYLRAFLAGRMGWAAFDSTLIISGAFGLFRRSLVVEAGGYASAQTSSATVGEDMELVVRIHKVCREKKIPYRIRFVPDPVVWTECPEEFGVLGRQRDRWQRGMAESLLRHRDMFFNPKYGRIGMFAYPYFFLLETFGPLIELAGYTAFIIALLLGLASPTYVITFFMLAFVFGMVLSLAAVGLEELGFRRYPSLKDLVRLFGLAIVENFGYRQITTLWRFHGLISALRGKQSWGTMPRRGFPSRA
jgi:cellulose synthase/poly-beta-1,6-N-acetylglucosamine synthase-like glycosyltransferase